MTQLTFSLTGLSSATALPFINENRDIIKRLHIMFRRVMKFLLTSFPKEQEMKHINSNII
jgi:hypothetical protein